MLKLNMWSDYILVSLILSSNLDLKEDGFFISHTNIWPLLVSTQDQSGSVLFDIDLFSPRTIFLWIWIKSGSFDQLLIFSWSFSFLLFSWSPFLDLDASRIWKSAMKRGRLSFLGIGRWWIFKPFGCVNQREKREGAWGAVWRLSAIWKSNTKHLGEALLNREEIAILIKIKSAI